MPESDGEQAEFYIHEIEKHQERKAGDNPGQNQGQQHDSPEERFPWELSAVECKCGGHAEGQCNRHGHDRNFEAVEDGIPNGPVGKQRAKPIEGEMVRRESANTFTVEGIKNKDSDRKIKKSKYGCRMQQEPSGRRNI